jgi:hypothetical protein
MRSFTWSELKEQGQAGAAGFQAAHPHDWLVWESGKWLTGSVLEMTLPPEDGATAAAAPRNEALGFALDLGPGPQFVRVGRDPHCDLVIPDATVSREHIALTRDRQGVWRVEPLTGADTFFRDILMVGDARPIASGEQFRIGQVLLTFYDAAGLIERLQV